jgi:hypothetical protein
MRAAAALAKAGLLLAAVTCWSASPASAQIIDRVLAVVDGQIITLSDARTVLAFGLIPADVSGDPVRSAMQRLIDRRLMLAEVERYAAPEPLPAAVDQAWNAVQGRFPDALAFEIALNQSPLSRDELHRFVRDTVRIDAYIAQRFASAVQVAEDDVVTYYREHPAEFTAGGRLRPYEEVRDAIGTALMHRQRDTFVRQWVDGLRRRAALQVVYLPEK